MKHLEVYELLKNKSFKVLNDRGLFKKALLIDKFADFITRQKVAMLIKSEGLTPFEADERYTWLFKHYVRKVCEILDKVDVLTNEKFRRGGD